MFCFGDLLTSTPTNRVLNLIYNFTGIWDSETYNKNRITFHLLKMSKFSILSNLLYLSKQSLVRAFERHCLLVLRPFPLPENAPEVVANVVAFVDPWLVPGLLTAAARKVSLNSRDHALSGGTFKLVFISSITTGNGVGCTGLGRHLQQK